MPDTYTSQFSGEEIDAALRAAQMISGASTLAELRNKLEIRGDTIPVSATDPTPISEALTASGGGINPNLLDNWYFGRPVNQRGQTEHTGEWKYTIDRWQISEGTLTVNDGSISHSGGYLFQPFSDEFSALLKGKLVTLSFLYANGSLESASATIPSTWGTWDGILDHESIHIVGINNGNRLWVTNTGNTPILAAKLELGDTQTLAHQDSSGNWILNEIPDFGEQLRRCTYYAEKVESADTPAITNSTFVPSGATSAVFILPYARKRTVPAINFNDVSNYRIIARSISGGTTAFSVTAISPLDVGRTKAAILVSFNATDQGFYCFLQRSDNAPAGYAFISADL